MREKSFEVKLIPIDSIKGAEYNPRKFDANRFNLIKESLTNLGWLIPAYTHNGTLLSGHQRTKAWKEMGNTLIPVVDIPDLNENDCRGLNILFNLATNDFQKVSLASQITSESISFDKSETDKYPCMNYTLESPSKVIEKYGLKHSDVAGWQFSKSMIHKGILVPIVIGSDGLIANGIKRLFAYARIGLPLVPIVYSNLPSNVISHFLNKVSMDFDLKKSYSDQMRYGSFRRIRLKRKFLGHGFSAWINQREFDKAEDFDHRITTNRLKLQRRFGNSIIDFGAGHLHETNMLRSIGFDVTPIEPYHIIDKDEPNLAASRKICSEFLESVASGKKFDSVVISSVFNSVPFEEDRRKILTIAASLCDRVFIGTLNTRNHNLLMANGRTHYNEKSFLNAQVAANYEKNTIIGELISGAPKAQKFYSFAELKALVSEYYQSSIGFSADYSVYIHGNTPKPIDKTKLIEAIEFEFNLPYPNGESLGLGDIAIEAWKKRGLL